MRTAFKKWKRSGQQATEPTECGELLHALIADHAGERDFILAAVIYHTEVGRAAESAGRCRKANPDPRRHNLLLARRHLEIAGYVTQDLLDRRCGNPLIAWIAHQCRESLHEVREELKKLEGVERILPDSVVVAE